MVFMMLHRTTTRASHFFMQRLQRTSTVNSFRQKVKIAIVLSALMIVSSAWSGEDELREQMQEATRQLRGELLKPLRQWEKEKAVKCHSENLTNASEWTLAAAAHFQNHDVKNPDIFQMLAGVHLDIADSARKRGCLNFADEEYRKVISLFIGSGYAAFRQRAQVGIDDIRAMRQRSVK